MPAPCSRIYLLAWAMLRVSATIRQCALREYKNQISSTISLQPLYNIYIIVLRRNHTLDGQFKLTVRQWFMILDLKYTSYSFRPLSQVSAIIKMFRVEIVFQFRDFDLNPINLMFNFLRCLLFMTLWNIWRLSHVFITPFSDFAST